MRTKHETATRQRPLTEHALSVLQGIAKAPLARLLVNPGVSTRLLRDGLVEDVLMPSPFKSDKGKPCSHLRLTASGMQLLESASKMETLS